jgi:uncharacterized protein (DUF2235 family)
MALYAFDGTWNKPDTDSDALDHNTNVYNFLNYYALKDAETRDNVECYEAGVGTRLGVTGRIVGGFFGAGGRTRVNELVESFRKNWKRNETEDRTVDVIGFSRGAALALHFCNQLAAGVDVDGEKVKPEIRFLGLWDVVPSFGLPGVLIKDFHETNIGWDLDVPKTVQHCYHAMALDERRGAFNAHRLDPENDDAPRIQELWFRGVHSDVGGGNGNVGRGNIALVWMLQRAAECGLPIAVEKLPDLQAKCDPQAPISHGDSQGTELDRSVLKNDRFHPSAGRLLAVGEKVSVEVDSKLWFDFSGLLVSQGAKYRFTPDAAGRWTDKTIECTASGWPKDQDRGRISGWFKDKFSSATGLVRRVPEANWFEMIACVGADGKTTAPIGHGQHEQNPWTSSISGPLFFFANDAKLSGFGHDFYQNNKGSISVTVERVA